MPFQQGAGIPEQCENLILSHIVTANPIRVLKSWVRAGAGLPARAVPMVFKGMQALRGPALA